LSGTTSRCTYISLLGYKFSTRMDMWHTWVLCFTVLHVYTFIHFSSKWDLIHPAQNPSSTSPWWAGGIRFMKPG
jgi:hypothetical protein